MSPREVTVDAPRADLPPVDPNVVVPKAVRDAAAAADVIHGQAYTSEQPDPAPVAQPEPAPQPEPPAPVDPAPSQPAPVAQPQPDTADDLPPADALTPDQWRHRYASMRGRYNQAQETISGMQETLSQFGDELTRTHTMLNNRDPAPPLPVPPQPLVTPQDREAYGDELIDLTKRAALEAVQPVVQTLKEQNDELKRRQAQADRQNVYNLLDSKVQNWRQINGSPVFKNWLRLRDVYLGGIRQQHLDAAFKAADAPRVVAFFESFLRDEAAIGSTDLLPQPEPPAPPAPRTPAVALASLAAPGRAKPAGGDPAPVVDNKPVYTRTQIAAFYANVRRGAYAGRESEKAAIEADIFAAQASGRVR